MNLVYEFPHPSEKYIVQSSFWRNKKKSFYEYETINSLPFCEPKFMLEMVKFHDNMLIIWHLLEKVLFGKSIVMFSKYNSRLVAWAEILKNLIFPFQFPGLIIPFMSRPDLMLLSAEGTCCYIVGMSPEAFKYCKNFLSPIVTCFDIDNRQLSHNKREFLHATDSEVINSPIIIGKRQEASCEIPISLYMPKIRDLEAKVKDFPKTKNEVKIKAYSMKIREHFLNFFINDLLDYKNCNYSHEELFLSHNRRKKLPKEHYEFIKKFSETQTFKIFQAKTKK